MHNAIQPSVAALVAVGCIVMRTFELRVYKLRTKEALDSYVEQIYPRHPSSFPPFGIEAHGFWTAMEDVEPRFFVLASYAAGEEPGEIVRRYMQSTEFAEDIRNFDVSDIVGVESTILIPSTSSPLK
jgi:hypothetical protein